MTLKERNELRREITRLTKTLLVEKDLETLNTTRRIINRYKHEANKPIDKVDL